VAFVMLLANVLLKAIEPIVSKQVRKADFNRKFRKAADRAVQTFRDQASPADTRLVSFLLDDAPALDVPAVSAALQGLVLRPARSGDQAQAAFVAAIRPFAP
jgi:hypothetical protein